jgi:hypothetical protein
MRRCLLILSLAILFLSQGGKAQENSDDVRLRQIVREYRQAEVTVPFPGSVAMDKLTKNVSILSVKEKSVSISLSPLTVEWFILQNYNYTILAKNLTKGILSAESVAEAMEWDKYPTYQQYDSIMQSFNTLYPTLCDLDTIGTSVNGKLVLVLKISDNPDSNEDEPEVFYSSTMHGDETGGYILMLRLADYLLKNYNSDARIRNLVNNLEIWINPLANPDGTYRSGNVVSSATSTRYNANGVDLNRNFPDPLVPSIVPVKENIDMIAFLRKHKFVISANFHSGAEVVNYPWDRYLSRLHADDSWFYSISRAYADTVHLYSSPYYLNFMDNGITRGAVWYRIEGGRQDFVTSYLQGREVTIELDDYFITPAAQLSLLWQNNYRSLLAYIRNALYGIHGIVTNVTNSAPVAARVFITGHDTDSSHVYSDAVNGSFYRYLSPGSWNLTFSAQGYEEQTVSNVLVVAGQRTELTVSLTPVVNSIDTTNPDLPVLYPNPATSEVRAVIPDILVGDLDIRIFNMSGKKVIEYKTTAFKGFPVIIELNCLAAGSYHVLFTNSKNRISSRAKFIVIK